MLKPEGRYLISLAAQRLGVHPSTLRKYERLGLLVPGRRGQFRLYSEADLERARRVGDLQKRGLNLAGVRLALDLQDRLAALTAELDLYKNGSGGGQTPPPTSSSHWGS